MGPGRRWRFGRAFKTRLAGALFLLAALPAEAETGAIDPSLYSPFAAFLAGESAFAVGDDPAAARFLAIATAHEPDDREIATRYLLALVNSGDFPKAAAIAKASASAGKSDPLIDLLLSVQAAKEENAGALIAHAAHLSGDGLSGLSGRLLGAWAKFPEGGLEAARREFSDFAGIEDLAPIFALHLTLMEDRKGGDRAELDRLGAILAKTTIIPSRLRELYAALLGRAGRKDEALRFRDRLTEIGNRPDPVLDQVVEALPEKPRRQPLKPDLKSGIAEALFTLATIAEGEEDSAQAKLFLSLALALDSHFDLAHVVLGNLRLEAGYVRMAEAEFAAVDPRSPYAWPSALSLADLDRRQGRIASAIARLEGLAAARPAYLEPLVNLGDLLRQEKRYKEAIAAYSRAIGQMGPPARSQWTIFFSRAVAHERNGEWPAAEADFKAALERSPDEPYVLNYLAYSWVEQRRNLDQALAMLTKAAERKPDDGYIADSLGWAYYQLGDFEKAVSHLERASELTPAEAVVNDHLGDAYWRVGRYREARFQWQRALNGNPEPDLIPKLEKKLQDGLAP